MVTNVRKRRAGVARISAKNQTTIPVGALRKAGLKPGDELRVEVAGAGQILLTSWDAVVKRHAGALTGMYPKGYLKKLRAEWRS